MSETWCQGMPECQNAGSYLLCWILARFMSSQSHRNPSCGLKSTAVSDQWSGGTGR